MEFALLTLCWVAVVVLAVAIKDRFIDKPRIEHHMAELNGRFDRLIKSFDLGVDALANVAEWLNGNMEEIARTIGAKQNGKNKGKEG